MKEIRIPEPARISVSFTRKFNVAQYESLDIHVGMSDNVKPEEERLDAWRRIQGEVYLEFSKLINLLENKKLKIGGKY